MFKILHKNGNHVQSTNIHHAFNINFTKSAFWKNNSPYDLWYGAQSMNHIFPHIKGTRVIDGTRIQGYSLCN